MGGGNSRHCPLYRLYRAAAHPYPAPFTPAVEIAWRFDPAFWGQGFATEAAKACLTFGFSSLGLTEIVAITRPRQSAFTGCHDPPWHAA
ncbi:MAG: GNAT family N-acetyltransferase [Xanthobacter sp.]